MLRLRWRDARYCYAPRADTRHDVEAMRDDGERHHEPPSVAALCHIMLLLRRAPLLCCR